MNIPFPDHAQLSNLSFMEDVYAKYLENPNQIDPSWRYFFEGMDFTGYLARPRTSGEGSDSLKIFQLIQSYRRFGHLAAHFNPLETNLKEPFELTLERHGFSEKDLDQKFSSFGFCGKDEALLREIVDALKNVYANRIGFEYMDLGSIEMEQWMAEKIEPALQIEITSPEKKILLEFLCKAELLETFFHTKYAGKTRFSLEGAETMIPLLSQIIEWGSQAGVEEWMIGMAHRGRLNVLANLLNKPYAALFEEFEDDTILSYPGNDDVKYHMGFEGQVTSQTGKKIPVAMAANPSHLESIDPVVLGQVRALQVLKNDQERKKIGAILIHGDASLAGQGVIYETLQLMRLPAYSTGGTIHLVVNNQIGYTTTPEEGRSTRYCTDIAKSFGSPVFHVNAEDPESCLFAAKLAVEIRQKFQCDVFIDLCCYRKYGHNEGDEPSYTQPLQYALTRSKQSVRAMYVEELLSKGEIEPAKIEEIETQYKEMLAQALLFVKQKIEEKEVRKPPVFQKDAKILDPFISPVDVKTLQLIAETFCTPPQSFHVHPKLKKWLQDRLIAVQGDPEKASIDWATGECLAFGSLLLEGFPIRLAGEDSQRGTFSQRHLVLTDAENGALYSPLSFLKKGQARFDVINTPLTEYAGMAFEYGYSWSSPKYLVLWEAQYGDFNNGAQIIIDQYLVSAEHKWNTPSSLTLLLPHAYEGAGPEHSSARLERFLQLAADNNIQVVNASTPAQYFHLLRRQAQRNLRKPLILFTPKSLLRFSGNMSRLTELTSGHFEEILDDPIAPRHAKKVLICSGKMYYDLLAEREKRKTDQVAILRIEQIYPLHEKKLQFLLAEYKECKACYWVQEEPENAGAWSFLRPYLEKCILKGVSLGYVGRPSNPTTSTGSHRKHKVEQQALLDQAFT
jgi:2-oxoglutarate dehydrogenase E1 component